MGRTAHIGPFTTPSRVDRAVAEEMLAVLGIDHLATQRYTEISGGERQLVLIARALAQEPRLVMDEPTASLDFGNQMRVLGEIEHLAGRGMAVMLSTHDPDHAFLCAHRVALLHQGRLARLGPPDEVITRESLREVYGVEVTVIEVARAEGRVARVCVPALGATGRGADQDAHREHGQHHRPPAVAPGGDGGNRAQCGRRHSTRIPAGAAPLLGQGPRGSPGHAAPGSCRPPSSATT